MDSSAGMCLGRSEEAANTQAGSVGNQMVKRRDVRILAFESTEEATEKMWCVVSQSAIQWILLFVIPAPTI